MSLSPELEMLERLSAEYQKRFGEMPAQSYEARIFSMEELRAKYETALKTGIPDLDLEEIRTEEYDPNINY
jgi:hypothetical protein